jgi:hypothetical protein
MKINTGKGRGWVWGTIFKGSGVNRVDSFFVLLDPQRTSLLHSAIVTVFFTGFVIRCATVW